MKQEEISEWIGACLITTYVIGVPVAGGYILAATDFARQASLSVVLGAIFWPAVLLGKIGVWLAS